MKVLFLCLVIGAAGAATHVIPGVPFVKQETQYCGPASLASVLSFYGDPVDQHVIGKAVFMEKIKGSLITDLQDYAKGRGFETKLGLGTPEDLQCFISQDHPVIVLVDFGFWVISRPHYLVVYGFNKEGFIAHDGFRASQTIRYEKFQDLWKRSGSSYLLVYR